MGWLSSVLLPQPASVSSRHSASSTKVCVFRECVIVFSLYLGYAQIPLRGISIIGAENNPCQVGRKMENPG